MQMNKMKSTNFRWVICEMLFLATTINYMDRQVLSLTWKDFIAPEFHWTDADYGRIAAVFSLVYAVANVFAGRFIDWIGTRKGYVWAIVIWSFGACMHAFCGLATIWHLDLGGSEDLFQATGALAVTISTVSAYFFIISRVVLGIGEAGNFPAAIKVTAEYFPKKDRAFATSIFNSGSTIGALVAPLSIPLLARYFKNVGIGNGWEMAFIIIGALGFVWLGFWLFLYQKPEKSKYVNQEELKYIHLDDEEDKVAVSTTETEQEDNIPFAKFLTFPQTWAIFFAKLITDGVWWFFLFWTPGYLSDQFGYTSSSGMGMALIFTLYAIVTFVSIYLCKIPTFMVDRRGMNPYEGRMVAMFLFACLPLLALGAQPLGAYSAWWPAILIGLACAGHQAWSANIYSVVGDMFPKSTIGT